MNSVTLYRKAYLQYITYKDSPYFNMSISLVCLIGCLLLVFIVIIPQLTNYFSLRQEISSTQDRITAMNNNITFLIALDEMSLSRDVATVTRALPPERDVSTLLTAINSAAISSGVILDDFSFQAGKIAVRGNTPQEVESNEASKITFIVQGSISQILTLIESLQEKTPILSISEIDAQFGASNRAEITVNYYTKPLPPVTEDDALPLSPLTPQNAELLEQLRSWEVTFLPEYSGSDSALPNPF